MIELKRTDSDDKDFRTLVKELDADLRERNGELMKVYDELNIIEKNDTAVVAYFENEPAGCGCFKHFNEDAAEIKRMFVRKKYRGKGISGAILQDLEKWAAGKGYLISILETGDKQVEALGLYEKSGYSRMPNY